ncbi:F-box/FBD/LRR-repeat protein-like protein [Tanacetum coccineum]
MDRLSELPLNIIETILCLVPIREAGRTSILSKEWRYRWTKIPKLVFDVKTFQVSTVDGAELSIQEQKQLEANEWQNTNNKLIYAAGQVLLMHDGPIHEFTLSLLQFKHCIEIDHIITHLSRRTSIKKLTLDFQFAGYMLPTSVFSFHQLTHLCLIGGCVDHEPTFNEFGSLESLILRGIYISDITLQHLLSRCPLVKTLHLDIPSSYITISGSNDGSNDGPTITELLECLPMIETLSLWFPVFDVFEDVKVPRELPTPLFHLKYLDIYNVFFTNKHELIIAFLYQKLPNCEKLKEYDDGVLHLNELEIYDFVYNKIRLDFVKFILARARVLKKVRLSLEYDCRDERFRIIKVLLGYSRASPEPAIIIRGSDKEILSKEWRYRWTKIPKLVFDVETFQVSTVDGAELSILEQKQVYPFFAPIDHCIEIDHIITHLSRRTSIKKLTLDFQFAGYMLPTSVFSFHQLTHLCLIGGCVDHEPTFNEFGSLESLILRGIYISDITLQHLLSRCPLVKTLHLDIPTSYITITGSNDGPTIMVLLECLPMIETLSLWFPVCDVFEDVKVPRELPTPLFHLKYLDIYNVFFTNKHELIIAFLMKNSPNLEKLKTLDVDFRQWSALESSGKFLNCQPVFPGLCSSPVLKKVRISLDYDCRDERVRLLKILLGYSGASAEVQIIVEDSCY